jgi:hypothetical protein
MDDRKVPRRAAADCEDDAPNEAMSELMRACFCKPGTGPSPAAMHRAYDEAITYLRQADDGPPMMSDGEDQRIRRYGIEDISLDTYDPMKCGMYTWVDITTDPHDAPHDCRADIPYEELPSFIQPAAAATDSPNPITDTPPTTDFARRLLPHLRHLYRVLTTKNAAYGDSAFNPIRIFSRADALEQLRVRIDDKLNRVAKGHEYPSEDTIDDLIGYLVLYKMATKETE